MHLSRLSGGSGCLWLFATCVAALTHAHTHAPMPTPVSVYDWVSVNYTWTSAAQLAEFTTSGNWIPSNNLITGVKVWGGNVYLSVPRWRAGVPATLNVLPWPAPTSRTGESMRVREQGVSTSPPLQPFPSWEWQDITNPAAIKYVQSMEITPDGVMWILDVGRLNIFDAAHPVVNGPPKLMLWSIPEARLLHTYVFTDDVASYSASFLNDLALDLTANVAYISDSGTGAIVVYDGVANTARRFNGTSTQADMSVNITINGIWYPNINTPADGIALSSDRATLYYCALRGATLYSISTAMLRDFSLSNDALNAAVVTLGAKPPSDGMAFTSSGVLFFGSLTGDAVMEWDTAASPLASQFIVATNISTMQWQDTFAFGAPGELVFTTNRLQRYFFGTMDFNGTEGPNMHVFSLDFGNGMTSYLVGQPPFANPTAACAVSCSTQNAVIIGESIALGVLVLVVSVLLFFRRAGSGSSKHTGAEQLLETAPRAAY